MPSVQFSRQSEVLCYGHTHIGADADTDRDSQDSLQAGTDSGLYKRQTKDGRHRQHDMENSNLDLLLVK